MIDHDTSILLGAHRDGELSAGETLAMERRLAAEPALRAEADRLEALSAATRTALAMPPASPMLRARVVAELGFADAAPPRAVRRRWQSLAAMLAVGLLGGGLVGGGGTFLVLAPAPDAGTADGVLAGHLRGLVAPQPFDVASSDRHVVKPWFNGRTTIAPQVPDFAAQGFPLAGGRIDVVDGRPVPTLVYRSDRHVISVTIVPKGRDGLPGTLDRDGSTILDWSAGDLTYWAVSDLESKKLAGFVALFRAELARAG